MSAAILTVESLRFAYRRGAFPMTMNDGQIEWFLPYDRALFPIDGAVISKSTLRTCRRRGWRVSFDEAFLEVMRGCLRPDDNWISAPFFQAYGQAHCEGWGHSCEVWEGEELVGGLYGLAIGTCFCAESMFHRKTDASKIALGSMVDQCRALGFQIFDAQIMNPHLASLGAYEISDYEYQVALAEALKSTTSWSESR